MPPPVIWIEKVNLFIWNRSKIIFSHLHIDDFCQHDWNCETDWVRLIAPLWFALGAWPNVKNCSITVRCLPPLFYSLSCCSLLSATSFDALIFFFSTGRHTKRTPLSQSSPKATNQPFIVSNLDPISNPFSLI